MMDEKHFKLNENAIVMNEHRIRQLISSQQMKYLGGYVRSSDGKKSSY
jgi:hypothetical protein